MALHQKLLKDVDEWNDPRRVRVGMPVLAGVGGAAGSFLGSSTAAGPGAALLAGLGAGLGATLAWVGAAALD